jgi:hypothetical protein
MAVSNRGNPMLPAPPNLEKTPVAQGLKYLDQLDALLKPLHDVGCKRDKAHNRELHYDQYCMLILLYLFNPAVKGLRSLQETSALKGPRNNTLVNFYFV